jgi:methylphosphotriester-DNA--protein-cysteine methyltransferase
MLRHPDLSQQQIIQLIRSGEVSLAGNSSLKVYGKLNCGSGKRRKKENRVFFKNETEALDSGFRPCGHCMRDRYAIWKRST